MAITKSKFTPSINITRDIASDFNYVPTTNSIAVFNQIFSEALNGHKVHYIIGAYGTGKSSFLLAIQQTLTNFKKHFKGYDILIKELPSYEFLGIIGEYASLSSYFARLLKLDKNYSVNDIFSGLDKYYATLSKKGKGLAILIDEFGKFLEYASKHTPESELYFIQQLAEWINDPRKSAILITTLHQDFNAYALSLSRNQQQEWAKVKGRFKEIVFNEPVEQLLSLAALRVSVKFDALPLNKSFDKLLETVKKSKAFPLRNQIEKDFAEKLFPLDLLAAGLLTLSLQEYGQNERSLFSFLDAKDYFGINDLETDCSFYNIAKVYDYLINSFYTVLTSQYNKHYTQWANIRTVLEKLESSLPPSEYQNAAAVVKTIGLLNIFGSSAAILDFSFYANYAKLALGIKNAEETIRLLEKKSIIRFQGYNSRYIFSEATDLNIQVEIDAAGKLIEKTANFLENLNQHFDFPFIPAKSVYYEKGTPRFFQFKLTNEPAVSVPEGEIDGFINLVFNEESDAIERIQETSKRCKEAILFGHYQNTANIQNTLFEIQKVRKVAKENHGDKPAIKALIQIEEHYVKLLNHYVLDSLYSNDNNIIWFYKGTQKNINSRSVLNQELSKICNHVYGATPVFKNELINKTKVSGQIAKARNKLISRLFTDIETENIGFLTVEFPPEKTIYLSLLQHTKIHGLENSVWGWQRPLSENEVSKSFIQLWDVGESFLESTKTKERSLQDFIDMLLDKPFKLKQGFIDIWIPIFLLSKNDEYALYEGDVYLPQLNNDLFELINKKPGRFKIKAFDVGGVKLELFNRYRLLLNQTESNKPTNKLFIQTIKPFLSFYRELPEYSKKTLKLDKKTVALRNVIANAKDPEKAFFEDFPMALGFSMAELQLKDENANLFITQMQEAIKQLRLCFDALIDRIEEFVLIDVFANDKDDLNFKDKIRARYSGLKSHLLSASQKSFFDKLVSPIDDRKGWLNSIVQTTIGKALSNIADKEEEQFYEKVQELVYELDNLCEISKEDAGEQEEEIVKIEITSFAKGLNKDIIRLPKVRNREVNAKLSEIRKTLGKDRNLNVTVLTRLLEELLKNE